MRIAQLTLLGVLAAPLLSAQAFTSPVREPIEQPTFKEGAAQRPTKTFKMKREDAVGVSSLSVVEIFTGLTIAPGQTLNLFGNLDWTGAETASLAIACPTATPLTNIQVFVYWQMPAFTNTYVATSSLAASNFAFKNMGGSVVPVFGNYFGLQLRNSGTTTVNCDQLTMYGVVR